jgi:hypothetical protein
LNIVAPLSEQNSDGLTLPEKAFSRNSFETHPNDLDGDGIGDVCDEETIISTNTTLEAGEYTFKNLIITNNSVLTLNSDTSLEGFKGVRIIAENLIVEEGSFISADGKGYPGEEGPGTGTSATGAGYGGEGGGVPPDLPGGPTYGSAITPVNLGSGGSRSPLGGSPGAGGGAIRLIVSNTLTVNGEVTANGGDGTGVRAAGGGSGGSVYVTTNILTFGASFRD